MDRSTSDRSGPAGSAATTSGVRAATRQATGPSRISGRAINTAGDEYEPLPSADGKRLIVATADGFFESQLTPEGWSERRKLGAEINANGTEIGPLLSPDEKSLLFSRDTKGPDSGEFFVWHDDAAQSWPPECPARAQ